MPAFRAKRFLGLVAALWTSTKYLMDAEATMRAKSAFVDVPAVITFVCVIYGIARRAVFFCGRVIGFAIKAMFHGALTLFLWFWNCIANSKRFFIQWLIE
jgi:hypothetical protein